MPRPRKNIRFYCRCCEKYYMGVQEQHMNWPTDKVNWRRCCTCNQRLFYGEHFRGTEIDFDMEPLGVSRSYEGRH